MVNFHLQNSLYKHNFSSVFQISYIVLQLSKYRLNNGNLKPIGDREISIILRSMSNAFSEQLNPSNIEKNIEVFFSLFQIKFQTIFGSLIFK